MNLYITADQVGIETGGGKVTWEESQALQSLGPCEVWGREQLQCQGEEPWKWDVRGLDHIYLSSAKYNVAHFYAGTFTRTVEKLKSRGSRTTYTAAAHSVELSKQEHEKLGIPYNYPHLTDPELWKRYLGGYAAADVLICPSSHSAKVMREFGCKNRIEIIPHGVDLPPEDRIKPFPQQFRVGYLGSYGPDKGVIYLLEAWKKLNYKDALLVLAGRDSISDWTHHLIEQYGGGNICLMGWVKDVADFYNNVSVYVQPSVTEGFGIEVLEAMSFGRPVICSDGAGAVDIVFSDYDPDTNIGCYEGQPFAARDVTSLCERIEWSKNYGNFISMGLGARIEADKYTWEKVRNRYTKIWTDMLK